MQLVQVADVAAEAPGDPAEQCGQPEAQQQIQRAVRGVLLQEAQATGQPAAQGELAQQVQLQPLSAPGTLAEEGLCRWGSGLPSPLGPQEGCQGTDALVCRSLEPKGTLRIVPKEGILPEVKP